MESNSTLIRNLGGKITPPTNFAETIYSGGEEIKKCSKVFEIFKNRGRVTSKTKMSL